MIQYFARQFIEQLVKLIKLCAFDIPMRLLGLTVKVKGVSKLLIE